MATPAPPPAAPPARTCEVRDWPVFRAGYHKGELYTPADIARLAANFLRLRGVLFPTVKLGHSGDQEVADRAKQSLGLASLGDVTGVRASPAGDLYLTLGNVPGGLGGLINAGRYRAGSIEVLPYLRDPADPAQKIDGPVLTGVALLGEEQPAVKGCPPPRAVWADGTPVPPDPEPAPWLAAMAQALKAFADRPPDRRPRTVRVGGHEYAAQVLCFSEVVPVRDQINQRLMAAGCDPATYAHFSDEDAGKVADDMDAVKAKFAQSAQEKAIMATASKDEDGDILGWKTAAQRHKEGYSDAPPSVTPSPAPAPGVQPTLASLAAEFSEFKKRFGAVEAAASDAQKEKDAAQMAAFSAQVDAVLTRNPKKLLPAERDAKRAQGLEILAASPKVFADAAAKAKAFSDWAAGVDALPVNPLFKDTVADTARPAGLTDLQRGILESETIRRYAPAVRAKLLTPAAK